MIDAQHGGLAVGGQRGIDAGREVKAQLHRLAHLYGGKSISPPDFQAMTGLNQLSPPLPDYVEDWKTLLHSKRRLTEEQD